MSRLCFSNARFPNKRIIYPDVDCCKRSDELFRKQHQEEHHTGYSPLLRIQQSIDMIYSFPLDYKHMCCLEITKKFYVMDLLFNKTAVKLKSNLQQKLSERMMHLKSYIPDKFQRKCRAPVLNLTASELRFLALYAGPVVFKEILSPEIYNLLGPRISLISRASN